MTFEDVELHLEVFADDFGGAGGRSPKELWLTEVAAGFGDETKVAAFATALMSAKGGLGDRAKYGHVARVSWFSEFFFPAFNVSGVAAKPMESWSSSLFNPFGELSAVGEKFFSFC